jgi:hypothetical protein
LCMTWTDKEMGICIQTSPAWRKLCWSCSKFTPEYRPGFWRSEAESEAGPSGHARAHTGGAGERSPPRYGTYTLARVSWRLDSLVSRHRRVTQNSWDSEIVADWCPWFFPFALEGFSTLNRVSPLWLISFYFIFHTSFITNYTFRTSTLVMLVSLWLCPIVHVNSILLIVFHF